MKILASAVQSRLDPLLVDMDLFIKLPPTDATKENRRLVCGFVANEDK